MFTNNESDKGHVTSIYYLIQNIKREFLNAYTGKSSVWFDHFKKSKKKPAILWYINSFTRTYVP